MATPLRKPVAVPPRPQQPPATPEQTPRESAADRKRLRLEKLADQPIVQQRSRNSSRTNKRSLTININNNKDAGGRGGGGSTVGQQDSPALPGSDFTSNEDIRAFANGLRRQARSRATERSMDAEHLRAVLRHIPDSGGSMSGAGARARRVARHLSMIAAAEKLIARQASALFASFEKEFESNLNNVGRARGDADKPRAPFRFE
jgi:hypothetical protein